MNAERRKQITEAVGKLQDAMSIIESVKDDEQDAYDNMPEGLQQGEKGEQASNALDSLDNALSEMESAKDNLESIE